MFFTHFASWDLSSERQRQRKVKICHGTLVLDPKCSWRGSFSTILCTVAAEACSWEVSFKDWSKNRSMSWNAPIRSHFPHWPYSNATALYISHSLPFTQCLLYVAAEALPGLCGKQPNRQNRYSTGETWHLKKGNYSKFYINCFKF